MPARNNVCIGLLSQKKLDEAINCFNETLQMANEWADAYKLYYGLGLAYARKGNFELAEINLKKALTLRPEFAPAQQYLSLVQAKQRQKTSQGGTSNFQN
jgi:tetratricopeptide (TPR) repeat protein